ncbi:hypothetical protein F2Q69_00041074 [Brassica cretica]|uniref:Uncharacterized protein n=1 Tax=Brassica cretica TaxID=69181 RepID=A0A8S9NI00_BRACR|nr:hypothetical protein F2Q69_00041074 [Brassica cretica]
MEKLRERGAGVPEEELSCGREEWPRSCGFLFPEMIWLRYMGSNIEEQTRMHGFGSYPLIEGPPKWLGRSLRSNRPSGWVGHYVVTDTFAGRSLRSDRPSGLVGPYLVTDSFAGRSLRSDRPNGLVGRYVATDRMAWSVATSTPTDGGDGEAEGERSWGSGGGAELRKRRVA